jgi:transcriptional regulator with XRE-family HTH domain
MSGYAHAGAMLRAFRRQMKLSQKVLTAKTQLVDPDEIGISECALSHLENQRRDLSPRHLKLIAATGVFTDTQLYQLCAQAAADMIHREFGDVLPPHIDNDLL